MNQKYVPNIFDGNNISKNIIFRNIIKFVKQTSPKIDAFAKDEINEDKSTEKEKKTR